MTKEMRNPSIDIIAFGILWASLPLYHWVVANEPFAKMIGSYGAAIVVVWRTIVLIRRAYNRWQAKRLEQQAIAIVAIQKRMGNLDQ